MANPTCFLCPLEHIPARYTVQWDNWLRTAFNDRGTAAPLMPTTETHGTGDGEFLGPASTMAFKGRQQALLAERLAADDAPDPDLVFFYDAWHPGFLAAAYVRDALGLDFALTGVLHAGTYDPWDFIAQTGMDRWGRGMEQSIVDAADRLVVATRFHKRLLARAFDGVGETVTVADFPVVTDPNCRAAHAWDQVVFPHRLAPEKDPALFDRIRDLYEMRYAEDDVTWVRTADEWNGDAPPADEKEAYYGTLARSKVAVSTARQETFGIAMQEARNLGAVPVAPDRLAYRETIPDRWRYETLSEAVDLIHRAVHHYDPLVPAYTEADAGSVVDAALTALS